MNLRTFLLLAIAASFVLHGNARADEPNLKSYKAPSDNKADEPMAKQYSFERAVSFLDHAALQWTDKRECFACHTNYAYLYARPLVSPKVQAHDEVRQALENMVTKRWPEKKPRWDAEVVASAAALAFNDAHTTKKLHPVTRTTLDRMWTVQRKDGGINWLLCKWPPMENDDHYGVTLAALAVGVAPDGYAKTVQAQKGLEGLRGYLKKNPPQNLHHKGMILWVATYLDGFMSKNEKELTIKELLGKQLPNGGWSSPALFPWQRGDKKEPEPKLADGYATGFTIYVLRQAGVPAINPAIGKGIAWLKSNQRESGRWYTRSLFRDNKHYLSHVGSAFAVMALQSCEATAGR
ncbi:MAG: terpene cyclase/mutase family protein [Planctomycetes bacterium]|nr:terpene cyclase/mutase family protein [Planctomycetota bacterium]